MWKQLLPNIPARPKSTVSSDLLLWCHRGLNTCFSPQFPSSFFLLSITLCSIYHNHHLPSSLADPFALSSYHCLSHTHCFGRKLIIELCHRSNAITGIFLLFRGLVRLLFRYPLKPLDCPWIDRSSSISSCVALCSDRITPTPLSLPSWLCLSRHPSAGKWASMHLTTRKNSCLHIGPLALLDLAPFNFRETQTCYTDVEAWQVCSDRRPKRRLFLVITVSRAWRKEQPEQRAWLSEPLLGRLSPIRKASDMILWFDLVRTSQEVR